MEKQKNCAIIFEALSSIVKWGEGMLRNHIELDIKTKCIEQGTTQTKLAEGVGTSPSYVSRIVKNKEQIVNKTFIAMMEQLGYDVELTYVKRGKGDPSW